MPRLRPPPRSRTANAGLAIIATVVILVADSLAHFEIAIAALYVVVVLIAADFLDSRRVWLVAGGCMALAVISHLLTRHGDLSVTALVNLLISLALIALTSYLALQRKSVHAALEEQAALIDLTHDTMFVRDMQDSIRFWNRGAEEFYGWKREEVIGRVSHELTQTRFPEPFEVIMEKLTRTGRWNGQLTHRKRDGSEVVVASRWSLQRNEGGNAVAILETNNDITTQQRAEEALQAARTELAHVNRVTTLGELAASITHEVNQPLTAVVTNGEVCLRLLAQDPPDLPQVRDAIKDLIDNGMRASEVIRKLRSLYKRSEPEKASFDLNDAIGDVLGLIQREVVRQGVMLRQELAPRLPPAVGDRVQIQQVVLNLIMNAAEAMASQHEPREIVVRSRCLDPSQFVIDVEDFGPGIDPANEARLFKPFFTTKPDGLGMGLAICWSIVEAHGGRLWVTANRGRGAAFHFTLPVSKREVA